MLNPTRLHFTATAQMAESDNLTAEDAISLFLVSTGDATSASTRTGSEKALDSFMRFVDCSSLSAAQFDGNLVSEWVSWMFSHDYAYNTVVFYVNRLSALYGKAIRNLTADNSGCFTTVKDKLRDVTPLSLEIFSIQDCFGRLRRLILSDHSANPLRRLSKDILLFSIYNGGISLDRIARFGKDEYTGADDAILAIVERYRKPRSRYLFPLNQSARTPNQLNRAIQSLYSDALRMAGINLSAVHLSAPQDLWAMIAMRCGISASDIAGCLPEEGPVNPTYSFATRHELTSGQKEAICSRVARILSKDPEEWYAMRFRPLVDYAMIQDRLKATGMSLAKSFYPVEEIYRCVGKKIKKETRPVAPGIMFFKSKATVLPRLFYQIGDLAWGYRYSKGAGSPYAIIPQKDIDEYQKAIGQFAESIEEYPEGVFRFEEGDKVEIISGEFTGRPAIFENEIRKITKDGQTVAQITNRLRLAGIENFSWTVELDPRQIAKISDEKFHTLTHPTS